MTLPITPDTAREAFSDRVMAAIVAMTPPSPTRSFAAALRTGSARDAMTALMVAWHLATQRDWPVPARLRARSFALVLATATLLATCSLVAASAARVFVPRVDRTEILEPRRSIIREPAPARIIPASSDGPDRATVIAAPLVVSVEVPKKEAPSTGGQAPPAPKKGHVGHGGSTAAHGGDSDQRDDTTPADRSDEGDQADDGDHTADAGTSRDAPDGQGTGGGDGHDGGDDHQAEDDGGTPGD